MSFNTKATIQNPLPFAYNCPNCLLKRQGYCEGIEDFRKYSMEHPSLIGCYDLKRLEKYLSEISDRLVSPPNTFHQEKINLSEIPFGVAYGNVDLTQCNNVPLFVISMNVFIKDSGDFAFRDMKHLKKVLKIPDHAKIALIGTSREKIQQAFWRVSEKLNLLERIAGFGFEWVTSTTFPVWDENPRADQIIHQFRNYLMTDLMAIRGTPVIPFVYPYNETDYKTFRNWVKDRPSINKIAILAQYYESDKQYLQLIENIEKIQDCTERELQFLIVGVTKKSKLEKTLAKFRNALIISWSPYYEAFLKGKMYDFDLKSKQLLDIDKSSIAFANYKTFRQKVEEIRKELNNHN